MSTVPSVAEWYATAPGRAVARLLAAAVRPRLGNGPAIRLLALGHAGPVLTRLGHEHERIAMVGPTPEHWPALDAGRACVGDPERLPFADALFDDALVIHALEIVGHPRAVLRELWRVLGPAGRLVLIVPNRAGAWARSERLPFGRGQPYGRRELTMLLDDAMFEVYHWSTALAAPAGLSWLEGPLAGIMPRLGGVHVVAARKVDGMRPVGDARRATAWTTATAGL